MKRAKRSRRGAHATFTVFDEAQRMAMTAFAVPKIAARKAAARANRRSSALVQLGGMLSVEELEQLVAVVAWGCPLPEYTNEMLRLWASGNKRGLS